MQLTVCLLSVDSAAQRSPATAQAPALAPAPAPAPATAPAACAVHLLRVQVYHAIVLTGKMMLRSMVAQQRSHVPKSSSACDCDDSLNDKMLPSVCRVGTVLWPQRMTDVHSARVCEALSGVKVNGP